jgi:hypothetical protein
VPLLDWNNEKNVYAFLDGVFNRFGAPTKVFTNQGTYYMWEVPKVLRENTNKSLCNFIKPSWGKQVSWTNDVNFGETKLVKTWASKWPY